ncbi:bifunctional methionine sulfoxide reductase B/A protein [Candidatus Dependentiae bacterium]|nr:bifunctional methionine sulfoxide reductase B/A protein [Candidatus Dependentiae bacterium]
MKNFYGSELSPAEKNVIENKGTEKPFKGEYTDLFDTGVFICRKCSNPLYFSDAKFHSGCGWPAFDQELFGAVVKIPDEDGMRTEIICSYCKGHLGHIFEGENFTKKNVRHCVNSISMKFIKMNPEHLKKAYFAGGCFWGVEYYFEKLDGIIAVFSGYCGGKTNNPDYKQVSTGLTGHAETVEIVYDSSIISYEYLLKLFFEIHDFTQINRQGPDIGTQYRTEIFYLDKSEKKTAETIIDLLKKQNYKVATRITAFDKFWVAEDYHQNYYFNNNSAPYCHIRKKIF